MMKADWECWKKIEEQFERIHGPFLFDSDKDDQDEAHQDKRIRQRWNVCGPFAAYKRDGYVALLPLPPPNSMGLPHQELCSKESEKDEEEKGREIHKLYRGKW
jgi:hypothetical protein